MSVGTVTVINSPIDVVISGATTSVTVTTYVDQVNFNIGEVTTINFRTAVPDAIVS